MLLAIHVVLLFLGTILFPQLSGPDEMFHADAVLLLGEGGGWPAGVSDRVVADSLIAVREQQLRQDRTAASAPVREETSSEDVMACGRAPSDCGHRLSLPEWEDATAGFPQRRLAGRALQHPPLYYAYLAATTPVASGLLPLLFDLPAEAYLLLQRLLSATLLVPIPFLVLWLARRMDLGLFGQQSSLAFALIVPGYFTRSGTMINNDALLILLTTLLTCWFVVPLDEARQGRWAASGGALLGLSLLTKGTALVFVPAVAVRVLMVGGTWSDRARSLANTGAMAFLFGGWWWLRNLVELGTLQPFLNQPSDAEASMLTPGLIGGLTVQWLEKSFRAFWGLYFLPGWQRDPAQLIAFTVAFVVLLLLGTYTLRSRRDFLVALLMPGVVVASVWVTMLVRYSDTGALRAMQGRYLYPFIGLMAVLAGAGLLRGLHRWPRVRGAAPGIIMGLVTWFHIRGFVRVLGGHWDAPSGSLRAQWTAWEAWTPLPTGIPTAFVVALAVLMGGCILLLARQAFASWRLDRPGGADTNQRSGIRGVSSQA